MERILEIANIQPPPPPQLRSAVLQYSDDKAAVGYAYRLQHGLVDMRV